MLEMDHKSNHVRGIRLGLIVLSTQMVIWSMLPNTSEGQFMRLTFEIESELEAKEVQPFKFGEVVPNAGRISIPKGDPNMGTYAITGLQNQTIELTMDIPDYLELQIDTTIYRAPLELEIAYANRNENNIDHAVPVSGSHIRFPLRMDAPPLSPDQPAPSATAFLYIYGDIEIGDVPAGVYEAELFLSIEYD